MLPLNLQADSRQVAALSDALRRPATVVASIAVVASFAMLGRTRKGERERAGARESSTKATPNINARDLAQSLLPPLAAELSTTLFACLSLNLSQRQREHSVGYFIAKTRHFSAV